jgi:gamma-glutamylcyclotransferase (GGCT)/AIG2-like uncharacterized protein YtfP
MYYFAYNINLDRKHMALRCPDAMPKYSAILPNYRLIFAGWSRELKSSIATIKRQSNQKVLGGIYEISAADIKLLDKMEGYPGISDRIKVSVWAGSDIPLEAETYILKNQSQEVLPSKEYLALLHKSLNDWLNE